VSGRRWVETVAPPHGLAALDVHSAHHAQHGGHGVRSCLLGLWETGLEPSLEVGVRECGVEFVEDFLSDLGEMFDPVDWVAWKVGEW
jgi:hypothetical protein